MRIAKTTGMFLMIALLGQVLAIQPVPLAKQQPILLVSPTSLGFEGQVGGPQPEPQYRTIANAGGGLMEWKASADAD